MPRRSGRASSELTRLVLETYGDACYLRLRGCTRVATTKDHIIPVEAGGTDDLDNFRPACGPCNSKRRNLSLAEITGVGAKVKVVIGPPAAGKSTLVAERAALTDLVIDLDAIARALLPNQSASSHVYPPAVKHVAIQMRKTAYQQAIRLRERCTVWLIHAQPSPDQLAEYAGMRYEIITVDPGRDVVMSRCRESRPPDALRWAERWYSQPVIVPTRAEVMRLTSKEQAEIIGEFTPLVARADAMERSRSW